MSSLSLSLLRKIKRILHVSGSLFRNVGLFSGSWRKALVSSCSPT